MRRSIKKLVVALSLVMAIQSCNQGPTLQTYYVDNELKPGFTSLDVPTSFLKIDPASLNQDQKEALASIKKLNVLTFVPKVSEDPTYKEELTKINTILKDDKYQELLRVGNNTDGRLIIKFIGNEEAIDELILFGNASNRGLAVVRVLGNHMTLKKIISLKDVLSKSNLAAADLEQFSDFFNAVRQ